MDYYWQYALGEGRLYPVICNGGHFEAPRSSLMFIPQHQSTCFDLSQQLRSNPQGRSSHVNALPNV